MGLASPIAPPHKQLRSRAEARDQFSEHNTTPLYAMATIKRTPMSAKTDTSCATSDYGLSSEYSKLQAMQDALRREELQKRVALRKAMTLKAEIELEEHNSTPDAREVEEIPTHKGAGVPGDQNTLAREEETPTIPGQRNVLQES